ncbi:MAG: baseplate J/gp47 family protein, partial [Clostridia bacterium]|nr:baseplate J/gp47 family protein [Clostridia bacterium]
RAAELGSLTALPNTITVMETVIAGVQSVYNPANNYITGATGELESDFRLRRNQSVTMPSQGFEDALEAQLLTLPTVTEAKVYSNRTGNATVNGIPAHTVWVIVRGGNADDIGRAIYNNIPPGIPMKGEQSVPVTRPNGSLETMEYDTASDAQLHVKMTIKLLSGAIDQNYIKQQLAQLSFTIGQSAESVDIATLVKQTIGASGTPYDVGVSLTGEEGSFTEVVTPQGLDEYFVISTENIDISVVS